MDLVLNHTSDQHRWFQEARRDPRSRYRDWYVWSKKRPPEWNRFYKFQPDLNVENPEVRTELRRIIGYWLELGVDGFRLDAVPFMIERSDTAGRGPKSVKRFEYLEEMRTFLNWRAGDAVFLGEANVVPAEAANYFREGHGLHMMFNFGVNQRLFYALVNLLGESESHADSRGFHRIALESFGYRWFRVGDLNYALRRTTETPLREERSRKRRAGTA